ncbi:MAG: hypothetical protein C0518_05740 [Opitutus sp.]|nr:hypothetical protein [Opitutus sp.]
MRPRLAAAGVMLAWIAFSMVLLLAFRGVPLRLRGVLIFGSLVVIIAVLGWLKLARAGKR